jgi:hypothetical protein
MAYGEKKYDNRGGNSNARPTNTAPRGNGGGNAVPSASGARATSEDTVFSTGLFKPLNENSKAVATIQLKEDVVLKAGMYINLYEADAKTEKSPIFRVQIRKGELKSRK